MVLLPLSVTPTPYRHPLENGLKPLEIKAKKPPYPGFSGREIFEKLVFYKNQLVETKNLDHRDQWMMDISFVL